MDDNVERDKPQGQPGLSDLATAHLWVVGLALDREGAVTGPGHRTASYWAACECPDLCLRDHEND
jgi:hypothetical protein